MGFRSRSPIEPRISFEWIRAEFLASGWFDYLRFGDCLVLKSDVLFRIDREPRGVDFDAPWLLPQDDFDPYLSCYILTYCCSPVLEFEMVQVSLGLEVPLPYRAGHGLSVSPEARHLADLVNDPDKLGELEDYLQSVGILVADASGSAGGETLPDVQSRLKKPYLLLIAIVTRLGALLRN